MKNKGYVIPERYIQPGVHVRLVRKPTTESDKEDYSSVILEKDGKNRFYIHGGCKVNGRPMVDYLTKKTVKPGNIILGRTKWQKIVISRKGRVVYERNVLR